MCEETIISFRCSELTFCAAWNMDWPTIGSVSNPSFYTIYGPTNAQFNSPQLCSMMADYQEPMPIPTNPTIPIIQTDWKTKLGRSDTRAPAVRSAYQLSKSDSRPTVTQDYIKRLFSCNKPAARPSYNLKDILGTEYITAHEAERALRNYVATILSTRIQAVPVGNHKLKLVPPVNTIPTSKVKIPDGSILVYQHSKTGYLSFKNASFTPKPGKAGGPTDRFHFWILHSL